MDVAMQRKGKELELIARQPNPLFRAKREIPLRLVAACLTVASPAFAAQGQAKQSWKSVEFAIVKFNDEAPKSWSMYHTEKKGLLLVRIWKRYLLVNVKDEEVYEIDPQTVKPAGNNVEWSLADKPERLHPATANPAEAQRPADVLNSVVAAKHAAPQLL